MNETAYALYEGAEQLGLLTVLSAFGDNIRVHVPMSELFCGRSIEELGLSVRSRNGLMRSGATTIGAVFEIIMSEEGLGNVRNLGKKSVGEIKTAMLVCGYAELNERERIAFWQDILNENELPKKS